MTPPRILLVGPSGGGKTTVGTILARDLGLPLISMDQFRFRRKPMYLEHAGKKVRTFESPLLWDSNAIAHKLRSCCQAGSGFVAEGNHLLMYPAIAAIPDCHRFYIDIPFAEALRRRKTRNRGTASDWSFALIGERETAKYVVPQLDLPNVWKINGLQSPEVIASRIRQLVTFPTLVPPAVGAP